MREARAHSVLVTLASVILMSGCDESAAPTVLPMPSPALALAVAPDFAGTIWAPTGSGDFRSGDGGHSWQPVAGGAGGEAVAFTEKYAYVTGPLGAQIADFGGNRLSPPRPTPERFVSVSSPYHRTGRLYALDERGRLWLSVRGGREWVQMRASGLPAGGLTVTAVRDLVTDPDIIYVAAGAGGLWRSIDQGATFVRVGQVPSAVAVALTTDDQDRVLVASDQGLYLSTDRGRSFKQVADAKAQAVALDPRNHRLAYAASNGQLLRSVDGGESWT